MSSITDKRITQDEILQAQVQSRPDRLSGTPSENKQVFDNFPQLIAGKYNGALNEIETRFTGVDGEIDTAQEDIEVLKQINAGESARQARESAQSAAGSAQTAINVLNQAMSVAVGYFSQTYNVTSSTSVFVFNPEGYTFSASNFFEVFINGLKLDKTQYSVNNSTITLNNAVADSTVEIVATTSTNAIDGAITKSQWLYSFPTKDASGDFVTIEDGGDNLNMKSFIVQIEPVQSGSGNPSPTNVRPITGWTAANVNVAGKNLIGFKSLLDKWGSGYTDLGDGSYNVTTAGAGYREPFRFANEDIDVALSGEITQLSGAAGWRFQLLNSSDETVASLGSGSTTLSGKGCKLRINYATGGEGANYKNIQVELGTAVTDYEPYKGNTYPVSFGSAGTVYGGTMDVVTGVLTVTHKAETFNGTEPWGSEQSGGLTNYYLNLDNAGKMAGRQGGLLDDEMMCNWLAPSSSITTYGVYVGSTSKYLNCKCSSASDVAAFKAMLIATPLVVVYPLATSQTHQLTPTQVQTLLGHNNVWADTGGIEFTYRQDPTLALKEISNQ